MSKSSSQILSGHAGCAARILGSVERDGSKNYRSATATRDRRSHIFASAEVTSTKRSATVDWASNIQEGEHQPESTLKDN
jgi:hypothetical protein